MFAPYSISDQKGFTLIELISILIILSVLVSVVVKRLDLLSGTASQKAILEGVKELNAREKLVWTNMKLSDTGWTNDADVFAMTETNLGAAYVWTAGPNASGGTLSFQSESRVLNRTTSTTSSWGRWD
ncbi:MAG: prepilin-type N-terminal cleavage/methylation domain-containing protein [Desulfobacteraceae bacterium]|jgi:prepilin-type N-terminal cleavage/methylation domain-containing protein